mgnify:CR=1 FL=1
MTTDKKTGITYRLIDSVFYTCLDVGCDDFEKARANRERQPTKRQERWWISLDNALTTKLGQLPKWVPRGKLPRLDLEQFSMEEKRQLAEAGFSVEEKVDGGEDVSIVVGTI